MTIIPSRICGSPGQSAESRRFHHKALVHTAAFKLAIPILIASAACLVSPVRAANPQITLTLAPTTLTTTPGHLLSLTGALANSTGFVLSLSGFGSSITNNSPSGNAAGISFQDSSFVNGLPDPLAATGTGSTYTGALFLNVGQASLPGSYTATYFVTYTDDNTATDFNGQGSLNLIVQGSAGTAPDAGSLTLLLAVGTPFIAFRLRRAAARRQFAR